MPDGREVKALLRATAAHALALTTRNILTWATWAVALAMEFVLVVLLWDGEIYGWEIEFTRWLQKAPASQEVFNVSNFLTNTISLPFAVIFGVVVGAAFVVRHWTAAGLLVLTFPIHVLAQFPKAIVDRPRPSPEFEGIVGVGGLKSFPSGHAEFVMSFYGFVAYLLVIHIRPWWGKAVVVGVWGMLAFSVGFGRIATGRHWPIDTVASYVFGFAILTGLVWLYTSIRAGQREVPGRRDAGGFKVRGSE